MCLSGATLCRWETLGRAAPAIPVIGRKDCNRRAALYGASPKPLHGAGTKPHEAHRFETFQPKWKIGCLQPGAMIDVSPNEFYRLAPPNVMQVMICMCCRGVRSRFHTMPSHDP